MEYGDSLLVLLLLHHNTISFALSYWAKCGVCTTANDEKKNFFFFNKDNFPHFLVVKWHWYWCWYFLNQFVCICKISSCFVTTNFWIRDASIYIIAVVVVVTVVVVVHHRIYLYRRGLGSHHRQPEEIDHRCWHRHRVHCPKHVH